MPLAYSSVFKAQDVKDVLDPINLLKVAIDRVGVAVSNELRDEVWRQCLSYHAQHINHLRVNQHAIDPYKLITWYGYILAHKINADKGHTAGDPRKVIKATLQTLNYCLTSEVPTGGLEVETISYMEDLVINEIEENPACGIGKNGLFLAFHTASTMKRKSNKSFSSGWGKS